MKRLADRCVSISGRRAVVVHDFTPYYRTLRHLYLPNEELDIAHHFGREVQVGHLIRWGETFFESYLYRVRSVRVVPTLGGVWFIRCYRQWPEIWVLGERQLFFADLRS